MLTFPAHPDLHVMNAPANAIFARVQDSNLFLFGIVSYGVMQDAVTAATRFGDRHAFSSPHVETEAGNYVGEDDVDAYLDHVAKVMAC